MNELELTYWLKAFNKETSKEDCLQTYCRTCAKKITKKRYEESVPRVKELKNKPCMDCGGRFPACAMDFDHVRGKKKFGVTESTRKWGTVLKEAKKCDLVCSNCHRIRTDKRRRKKK